MIDALLYPTKRLTGYERSRLHEMEFFITRPEHPNLSDDAADVPVYLLYSYLAGSPDSYDASRGGPGGWDPGDPPEAELYEVSDDKGSTVTLTDDETDQAMDFIYANHREDRYF